MSNKINHIKIWNQAKSNVQVKGPTKKGTPEYIKVNKEYQDLLKKEKNKIKAKNSKKS